MCSPGCERVTEPLGADYGSSFIRFLWKSNGPKQVLFIQLLSAIAWGSTIAIGPEILTDRYARIDHGYDGKDCSMFSQGAKPPQCMNGFHDAQNSASLSMFVNNILTFITSSLIGSVSDKRGRRGLFLVGLFIGTLPSAALFLLCHFRTMRPGWYYTAYGIGGLIDWFPLSISCLSDTVPPKWRASSYGLMTACFILGFSLSPLFALLARKMVIMTLSLALNVVKIVFAQLSLQETLRRGVMDNTSSVDSDDEEKGILGLMFHKLVRPLRELSILNRDRLFRSLATLAFFSGMVSAADRTVEIYYAENQIGLTDREISVLLTMSGLFSIFVLMVLLRILIVYIGERAILVVAFLFYALSNVLYGLARSKVAVLLAVAASTVGSMSFPVISAIKANNVTELEQGRIQGALFSVSSFSGALGPAVFLYVFNTFKDSAWPGPGLMFLVGAVLQLIAVIISLGLPKGRTDSRCWNAQFTNQCPLGECNSRVTPLLEGDHNSLLLDHDSHAQS